MAHPKILDVPVELGLKFMAVVGANRVNAEGELLDYIIHKVNRILLSLPLVNLQRSYASGIIKGRVLKAPHLLILSILEIEKLHIDLDVMAGHLFFVSLSENGPFLCIARQTVQPVALENLINAALRNGDVVVAFEIPGNAKLTEMISLAKVENLLFNLGRSAELGILRAGFAVDEGGLTLVLVGALPPIEYLTRYTKMAASVRDVEVV